jgi:3-methylcrotonyl-CoA carboxylase beta subunit
VRALSFASIARRKLYWAQAPIREMMDATATAYHSTAEIWDDGIIDPRDTRDVLGMAISAALNSDPEPDRGYGVFRM